MTRPTFTTCHPPPPNARRHKISASGEFLTPTSARAGMHFLVTWAPTVGCACATSFVQKYKLTFRKMWDKTHHAGRESPPCNPHLSTLECSLKKLRRQDFEEPAPHAFTRDLVFFILYLGLLLTMMQVSTTSCNVNETVSPISRDSTKKFNCKHVTLRSRRCLGNGEYKQSCRNAPCMSGCKNENPP